MRNHEFIEEKAQIEIIRQLLTVAILRLEMIKGRDIFTEIDLKKARFAVENLEVALKEVTNIIEVLNKS